MYVITSGEIQFIVDTLKECASENENVEEAVEECIELLEALETVTIEELEQALKVEGDE